MSNELYLTDAFMQQLLTIVKPEDTEDIVKTKIFDALCEDRYVLTGAWSEKDLDLCIRALGDTVLEILQAPPQDTAKTLEDLPALELPQLEVAY